MTYDLEGHFIAIEWYSANIWEMILARPVGTIIHKLKSFVNVSVSSKSYISDT